MNFLSPALYHRLCITISYTLFVVFALEIVLYPSLRTLPVLAATDDEYCQYGARETLDRFQIAQQEFEPTINILVEKKTIPTEELIPIGVRNLRQYQDRLDTICEQVEEKDREEQNDCQKKLSETFGSELHACRAYVNIEMRYQRTIFEHLMFYDVAKKKVTILLNKYKDLNTKFNNLIDIVITVRGEFGRLDRNIGKKTAKNAESGK